MTAPRRPVLRYHGGKWKLAEWVLTFFPPHRTYVEPFGGAASVLMRKSRAYAEIYGDLDGEVVNVFRVLRDPDSAACLRGLLHLTPYARWDFEAAYKDTEEPVERARRTIIKSFMGFGSTAIHDPRPAGMRTSSSLWRPPTAFRAASQRSGTTPAHDWSSYPDHIIGFAERLRGVVIEQKPALEVIAQHDRVETLHYVDPPYLHSTRSGITGRNPKSQHRYRHEMTDEEHVELGTALRQVKGMVVLSGYDSPMYAEMYAGWERHDRPALADKAKPRLEVVWLNPACVEALRSARDQGILPMFPAKGPAKKEKLLEPKGAKCVSPK